MSHPGGLGFRHPRVQRLRRLVRQRQARDAERLFVFEGRHLLSEALDAGARIEAVYAPVGGVDPVVARASEAGVLVHRLDSGVLERVADTRTPQPVLAVAHKVDVGLDDVAGASLVLVCSGIQDPGNLGTVLRSAEAAGADAVLCCAGCTDVFGPKAVRASAGSIFHVMVVAGGEPEEVLGRIGTWGMRRLGTRAQDGCLYDRADLTVPTALVLGNESHGMAPELDDVLDGYVTIPMYGRSESLNVGMAAAILSFEAARQRRGEGRA